MIDLLAKIVPPKPNRLGATKIFLAGTGTFIALGVVAALSLWTGNIWIVGSFGATCVLLFGFPDVPFSRTKNVIGGHLLSTFVGLFCLQVFGVGWWSLAIAGACAVMLMMATDTVHPPAGSNPVIVFLSQPDWTFLFMPVLAGVCALVVISKIYWHFVKYVTKN